MAFLKKLDVGAQTEVYGALDSIKFNAECLFDGVKTKEDLHELYMDIEAVIFALKVVRDATIDLEKVENEVGMTDYERELDEAEH